MSAPMTDLAEMLTHLDVEAKPGGYVFACVETGHPAVVHAEATVTEREGLTVVLPATTARALGLPDSPAFAWLTLTIHSSLDAVGLTAAFSRALADRGISCNVLAGFHHDHLLVPLADRDASIATLRRLRTYDS